MDNMPGLTEPLNEREQEILACLVEGLSNREIAGRLYLAYRTVKWYNTQIYSKLGVNNRDDAVTRATTLGLLDALSDHAPDDGKHNLPAQATAFVGRQHEVHDLLSLLDEETIRLITLLATGGMGKTRLSLAVAETQIGRYVDGVYFVPLAPLSSPDDIVTTIAENVGFVFHGEQSPAQQLVDFLKDRAMLLVLDNFEHLLKGVTLVTDIVRSAPNIKVIVTSRERLNLRGEHVYHLRGLQFPTWETPEDALEYDAVKLFVQSARRVRSRFALQPDELGYLARICRLTVGMPLGIELAAGWVDVLSLEHIAGEIQKGIDILETEMRDVPERHRSLRATFERTWHRLTEEEQQVFTRLSVFRGGFTLDAAEAVARANTRHLRKLAQKALIQIEEHDRYGIHELLRQFAENKLTEMDERPLVQQKHAVYFADFMSQRQHDIMTNRQLEALQLIESDYENIRTAWLYFTRQINGWEQFSSFIHGLWFFCDVSTRGQDAVDLFEQALLALQTILPQSSQAELVRGRILARLSWFYNDVGMPNKGLAVVNGAIEILKKHDSLNDLLSAYYSLGLITVFQNQPETTLEVSQEGLQYAQASQNFYWEARFLLWSAFAYAELGESVQVKACATKGLEILEHLGDQWGILRAYSFLGLAALGLKDFEGSKHYFDSSLRISTIFGNSFLMAFSSVSLAEISIYEHDYSIAQRHLKHSLQLLWDVGYMWFASVPLIYIARVFANQNDTEKAIEIIATTYAHSTSLRYDQIADVLHAELKAAVEPGLFATAWERGQKRELSAVVKALLSELEDS